MKAIHFKLIVDDEAITPEEIADQIVDRVTEVISVYQMHKQERLIGLYETDERPLA